MLYKQLWMKSLWDLSIEEQQAVEEGKDLSTIKAELDNLLKDNRNPQLYESAEAIYQTIQRLPIRQSYSFVEPESYDEIKRETTSESEMQKCSQPDEALFNQIHGAWLGRIAGCLLGQPVEGDLPPDPCASPRVS